MGKVISYIKRPFINYAVEAKTERLIKRLETEKPTQHPLYPTEQRVLNDTVRMHPELSRKIKEKSERLDDFLKQIKVTSQDSLADLETIKGLDSKKLPVSHPSLADLGVPPEHRAETRLQTDFGLPDPPADRIPPGRISFCQTVKLLQMASSIDNADLKSVEKFAVDNFQFGSEKTRLLLKYFRPFAFSAEYERVRKITDSERVLKGPAFAEHKEEMSTARLKGEQEIIASHKRVSNIRRRMNAAATDAKSESPSSDSQSSVIGQTQDYVKEASNEKVAIEHSTDSDWSQNQESRVNSQSESDKVERTAEDAKLSEQTDSTPSDSNVKLRADSDSRGQSVASKKDSRGG